ncbi:MAG TPA: alpha/beta fold hydrolase [Solirubrobacterales bacterium]|nr:alpha/beta fold hydrolase [Solirubrobacterales bacterium]
MAATVGEARRFEVERDGQALVGEALDAPELDPAAPSVVLLHAITASRRYVVHGSKVLPRKGFASVCYDARGHGESGPAQEGSGYGYEDLVADLGAVIDEVVGERRPVIAGSSMGAHTAVAFALRAPERIAGLVAIGPAFNGLPAPDEVLREWDELADGLESDGVDGFLRAYESHGLDPEWRDTLIRITRERLVTHRHPEAVAEAMREVPRDRPFEDMSELEFLDVPALVVASNDEADPGHPYAVAQTYAERLPQARLVSEETGQSPLSWQGGRLSREIAAFCATDAVAERAVS